MEAINVFAPIPVALHGSVGKQCSCHWSSESSEGARNITGCRVWLVTGCDVSLC